MPIVGVLAIKHLCNKIPDRLFSHLAGLLEGFTECESILTENLLFLVLEVLELLLAHARLGLEELVRVKDPLQELLRRNVFQLFKLRQKLIEHVDHLVKRLEENSKGL